MRIYLLRHGHAEAQADRDENRALTPEGQNEAITMGALLAKRGVLVDRICSSPLKRAVETATLVARAMQDDRQILLSDRFIPEGDPNEACEFILALGCRSILVVSHLPILPEILDELTGRSSADGFVPCELYILEYSADTMTATVEERITPDDI